MSDLSDREKAFESKFKHDEEFKFKVNVRGVKLFGRWAGETLGLTGGELETYAASVVDSDFDEPGTDDVIRKIEKDFEIKALEFSRHRLESELRRCMDDAFAQLMSDKK